MSSKKIYITMLGRSIWAVLNTYYAVLKGKQYYPDDIILIAEPILDPEHTKNLKLTKKGLALTSNHFGITPAIHHQIISEVECEVGSDDDFIKAVQCVSSLIKKRKKAGDTVALDITPGKKTLVTGALLPITLSDMDHVFYLSVKDITAAPFMMIPFQIQHIKYFTKLPNDR